MFASKAHARVLWKAGCSVKGGAGREARRVPGYGFFVWLMFSTSAQQP